MQRAFLSQENGRHRYCWVPSKSLLLSQNALEEGKRKAWGFKCGHRCGSATVRGSQLLTDLFLHAHRAWFIFQCTASAGTRLASQSSCRILSVCVLTPTYLVRSSPLPILQGNTVLAPGLCHLTKPSLTQHTPSVGGTSHWLGGPSMPSHRVLDSQLSPPVILFPKDTHQDKGAGISAEAWPHPPLFKTIWLQGQELRAGNLGQRLKRPPCFSPAVAQSGYP